MDREDRWSLYLREHLEQEKSKLDEIDPLVIPFAGALEKFNFRRLADIGCGLGRHSLYLAKRNFTVFGCDISEGVLQMAEQISVSRKTSIQFIQADYLDLPFYNEVMGGVLAVDTLHHDILENVVKGLKEVHRVLVPGGVFAFNPLSTGDSLYGSGRKLGEKLFIIHRLPHYFFDRDELELLLNRLYFKIESIEPKGFTQEIDGEEIRREKFNVIVRKVARKRTYHSVMQPLL